MTNLDRPQHACARPRHPERTWLRTVGTIAGWVWTILAAGGGAMLLVERGPWRLTNGWFALLSGIAACPVTSLDCQACLSNPAFRTHTICRGVTNLVCRTDCAESGNVTTAGRLREGCVNYESRFYCVASIANLHMAC